ncbi:MAG: RibD family protein, partial [Candidatus Promineifilaceae bacterium]
MDEPVLQLYPPPAQERPLPGLYLAHDLRQHAAATGRPYIYADFVASLDGRIAVPHPTRPGLSVPKDVANDRDWRLFQELAAQADLIISTGRYLRDWAEGRAQELLELDDPRYADLRAWREAQGLRPQPDIAIVSRSLDFPLPDILTEGGRKVVFFTTGRHDQRRLRAIEARAGQVRIVGEDRAEGRHLAHALADLGYGLVYSAAGPQILHMLLSGRVLDRLYLTYANRILGGERYAT